MRFIKFNDEVVDSFQFMELVDLAKTLTKDQMVEVQFGVQSYYHPVEKNIYVSHFWNHRPKTDKMYGMKSDVYLRGIGSYHHTDFIIVEQFLNKIKHSQVEKFGRQLFMLLEDMRLEDKCILKRPGTKRAFIERRKMYRKYFQTQLTANLERSLHTDALFSGLFILLTADSPTEQLPSIDREINLLIPFLQSNIMSVYEAKHTEHIQQITLNIVEVLEEVLEKDILSTYFILPEIQLEKMDDNIRFDKLKRQSKLSNNDYLTDVKKGDEDLHDDKMPTWHRETSKPTKSFLQFHLEHGTQTDFIGDGVREGDSGDQALAMVQGRARQTTRNQYSYLEAERMDNQFDNNKQGIEVFGKENRFAKAIHMPLRPITNEEKIQYDSLKKEVIVFQKKLKNIMQKTLEMKKTRPKTDYHYGRLSKKFIRLWTDDNPPIFYKTVHPSTEIDAVFTLLVDCSASMYDKMAETKRGIILFHEALKSVLVPHKIVGFWEDTADATETYQPNFFQTVIGYSTSIQKSSGPEVLQLEPKEDNRDGFAIRFITKELMKRQEKQKFLIIFSDGEPAAFGYEQNGIVDTHEAVLDARKCGIEVINIFLSNGEVDESQRRIMENIYGNYSLIVPELKELPDFLFPLLKKLLQKSITL